MFNPILYVPLKVVSLKYVSCTIYEQLKSERQQLNGQKHWPDSTRSRVRISLRKNVLDELNATNLWSKNSMKLQCMYLLDITHQIINYNWNILSIAQKLVSWLTRLKFDNAADVSRLLQLHCDPLQFCELSNKQYL